MILTALAAVLAFIPLTESVFWGSLAYTLIGGTAAGTALIPEMSVIIPFGGVENRLLRLARSSRSKNVSLVSFVEAVT